MKSADSFFLAQNIKSTSKRNCLAFFLLIDIHVIQTKSSQKLFKSFVFYDSNENASQACVLNGVLSIKIPAEITNGNK